MSLQNVSKFVPGHMVPHHRSQNFAVAQNPTFKACPYFMAFQVNSTHLHTLYYTFHSFGSVPYEYTSSLVSDSGSTVFL